jgi:transcriptional regulator with XRE-family HTH domain
MTFHAILKPREDGSERRSAARRTLRLVTHAVPDGGPATPVVVHDLSVSGLLIETDAKLKAGETLAMSLPHGGASEATVVWSSSRFFGCRFTQPLSRAVLSAALLKAEAEPTERGAIVPASRQPAKDLPARLTALRQARGLTGDQLAKRIGVSRQALWYWETGRRTPRPEQLGKVAAELGIQESDLLAGGDESSAQAKVIHQCKRLVAEQYGVDPASVRIMVEL